jgi:hypothetical protein
MCCQVGLIGAAAGLVGALIVIVKMLNIGPPCAGLPVCHATFFLF